MTDHPRRADDPHAGRARATPDCDRDDVGPGARTVAPSAAAEGGEWATVVRGEAPPARPRRTTATRGRGGEAAAQLGDALASAASPPRSPVPRPSDSSSDRSTAIARFNNLDTWTCPMPSRAPISRWVHPS